VIYRREEEIKFAINFLINNREIPNDKIDYFKKLASDPGKKNTEITQLFMDTLATIPQDAALKTGIAYMIAMMTWQSNDEDNSNKLLVGMGNLSRLHKPLNRDLFKRWEDFVLIEGALVFAGILDDRRHYIGSKKNSDKSCLYGVLNYTIEHGYFNIDEANRAQSIKQVIELLEETWNVSLRRYNKKEKSRDYLAVAKLRLPILELLS